MKVFQAYYGMPSVCLYFYREGEILIIKVILGEEGTRMGCIIGGTGFNITVHHFIYEPLVKEFPEYKMYALTDDLPALIPCPEINAPQWEWERHFDLCAEFYAAYDVKANPIGIFRHKDKCKVLIPQGAPMPLSNTRANGITLNIVQDGFIVGGGAVGSDDYYLADEVKSLTRLVGTVNAMVAISPEEPQLSVQMIGRCANLAHAFKVRVTPPGKIQGLINGHDGIIEEGLNRAAQPTGVKP